MTTRFAHIGGTFLLLAGVLALVIPAGAEEAKKGPVPSTSVAPGPRKATGWEKIPLPPAAQKGIKWLVLAQGPDGGWGTNGAPKSGKGAAARTDVGNTSLAAMAILATGSTPSRGTFQRPLLRAVRYVLARAESANANGLDLGPTTPRSQPQTQLERKIGPHADTFLATRFLTEVDGRMPAPDLNRRVRAALVKLVRKIQTGQSPDGSWNQSGGWAPIHSTSIASQALWLAKARGIRVDPRVFLKVNEYTVRHLRGTSSTTSNRPSKLRKSPRRKPPVTTPGSGGGPTTPSYPAAAGVLLYSLSQGFEQLSRTPADRRKYAKDLLTVRQRVVQPKVLKGLGSMGGEEFISYNNINLALARIGGRAALYWNLKLKEKMTSLQNRDGSWVGHHCITGRTACTSVAVLTLTAERTVPRKD